MATLYTVAYPHLAAEHARFVESFRRQHDRRWCDIVAAHVTLLFGIRDLDEATYTAHVRAIAAASSPIPFTCRYAMLGADHADDTAYVFLVPDEGWSGISLLHDRLYGGPLEPFHRLDVPYVPHITIATLDDRRQAKALCEELNGRGLAIPGELRTLTIGSLQDDRFTDRSTVALGG